MIDIPVNAVIKHAKEKGWETVKFTLIYERGNIAADPTEPDIPDVIITMPVNSQSAELRVDRDDKAMFWSYSENPQIFIEERHIPPTEGPEPVLIMMEPVDRS